MKISYFPGCSLEGTASDYAMSIEAVSKELGIELQELPDWNCCGATAAHAIDHRSAVGLPGRNLSIAEGLRQDLVIPCPMCFNRMKSAEKALLADHGKEYDVSYGGSVKIYDLADFMARPEMLELIESRAKRSLGGLKAVCYYGCMSSRPPKVTDAGDYEDPTSMDRILTALGADVKPWSHKTDCCGASHALVRRDIVYTLVENLYAKAVEAGADCIVVSCQMCQANLDMYQGKISHQFEKQYYLPVLYFTELIGTALGMEKARSWMHKHFVRPDHLFKRIGLGG